LAGVPDDEQAKPAPDHDPGIADDNTARVYKFNVARLTRRLIANLFADRRGRRGRVVHRGRALPVLARRGGGPGGGQAELGIIAIRRAFRKGDVLAQIDPRPFCTTKTGKDEGELAKVCIDLEQSMKP
jgi:hypothetical protein